MAGRESYDDGPFSVRAVLPSDGETSARPITGRESYDGGPFTVRAVLPSDGETLARDVVQTPYQPLEYTPEFFRTRWSTRCLTRAQRLQQENFETERCKYQAEEYNSSLRRWVQPRVQSAQAEVGGSRQRDVSLRRRDIPEWQRRVRAMRRAYDGISKRLEFSHHGDVAAAAGGEDRASDHEDIQRGGARAGGSVDGVAQAAQCRRPQNDGAWASRGRQDEDREHDRGQPSSRVERFQRLPDDGAGPSRSREEEDVAPACGSNLEDEDQIGNFAAAPTIRDVARSRKARSFNMFRSTADDELLSTVFDVGIPNRECSRCRALVWADEVGSSAKNRRGASLCCQHGKFTLPSVRALPPFLSRLYSGRHAASANFLSHLRQYNGAFQFATSALNIDQAHSYGVGQIRVQGRIYHRMGALLPPGGHRPAFAQLYVIDSAESVNIRLSSLAAYGGGLGDLQRSVVAGITAELESVSPYVSEFKRAITSQTDDVILTIRSERATADKRYADPRAGEIAGLLVSGEGCDHQHRHIVVSLRRGGLQEISELKEDYMPLHFVLLFPNGDAGWRPRLPLNHRGEDHDEDVEQRGGSKEVSAREFAAYRIQRREGQSNHILQGRKLFQEYAVDSYAVVEAGRMRFIRDNQKQLRCDVYRGLTDAVQAGETDASKIGTRVILPSSFTGGPRYMQQRYQDAMAAVRRFGKPDLFLTITCNPKWKEIVDECSVLNTKPEDRPDITVRVFRLKLRQLMTDLVHGQVLGRVVAHMHSVEFQKRGLPHAHILLILHPDDAPSSPEDYDRIICAELPDPALFPDLSEVVRTNMIHGPCGKLNLQAPCMKGGEVCHKKYPRDFAGETVDTEEGYPIYRRRNNGRTVQLRPATATTAAMVADNRWVVPYNRELSSKYSCHLNVEVCNGIRAAKYIYKYVCKGHDKAALRLSIPANRIAGGKTSVQNDDDEITSYVDARYVSATEAMWRLYAFPLGVQEPSVVRLQIHLPGQRRVTFNATDSPHDIVNQQVDASPSMLQSFFTLVAQHPADATLRQALYVEIPESYKWDRRQGWIPRKQQGPRAPIARIYAIHASQGELFFLRILLLHVRGPRSFDDVKIVGGTICATFREACIRRGLLREDAEWSRCLQEAGNYQMPRQLRELFVSLLLFCDPADPGKLWTEHESTLIDDFLYMGQDYATAVQSALRSIAAMLQHQRRNIEDYQGLPAIVAPERLSLQDRHRASYDTAVEAAKAAQGSQKLNQQQREAYDAICQTSSGLYFIDSPGGCGKTFLLNVLLSYFRGQDHIALACATSGVAALLLQGGATAHSTFNLPLQVCQDAVCNVPSQSPTADLLRAAKLIVWDELPAMHRCHLQAVDKLLRDVMPEDFQKALPFGGKIVVVAGDFRQLPPVVRHGGRAVTVQASPRRAPIWSAFVVFQLRTNMRVAAMLERGLDAGVLQNWATQLLQIGDGKADNPVTLPSVGHINCAKDLALWTFGDLARFSDPTEMNQHRRDLFNTALLAPLNREVEELNNVMIPAFPGGETVYLSADEVEEGLGERSLNVQPEYLNTLTPNGQPPHRLVLKVGMPVIMLRNLNPPAGLANGTRLIVQQLDRHVIRAEIVTGHPLHVGKIALIPRIPFKTAEGDLPFVLRRQQFPLKPAFAMTINKAQGQTLSRVGLYLRTPVFSHGQLYVAMSRTGDPSQLLAVGDGQAEEVKAHNIVYQELVSTTNNNGVAL